MCLAAIKLKGMHDFTLTPFDGTTTRFQDFKAMVEKFYRWKWSNDCPWDGSEAKQLSLLLKASPTMTVQEFARALYYYSLSGNITPGERPRKFLPRIHDYTVKPIDRFGKDPDSEKVQSKQLAQAERNQSAIDRAFGAGAGQDGVQGLRRTTPRRDDGCKGRLLE